MKEKRGFTLGELFAVLTILSITAAILFPVVSSCGMSREQTQRNQCMSNLKQVGLALLSYAQDNDATFPPSTSLEITTTRPHASQRPFAVSPATSPSGTVRVRTTYYWLGRSEQVLPSTGRYFSAGNTGYLSPYITNASCVRCSTIVKTILHGETNPVYMTNDLAGGASLPQFANPAVTVAAMDGEAFFPSTGHAYEATERLNVWLYENWKKSGGGAVGEAAKRHGGGANYLLADGHVKWFKPEAVFFPPRNSMSSAHFDPWRRKFYGPNPGGPMDLTGLPYQATFHSW